MITTSGRRLLVHGGRVGLAPKPCDRNFRAIATATGGFGEREIHRLDDSRDAVDEKIGA